MTVQLPEVGWLFIHGQPDGVGNIRLLRTTADTIEASTDAEGRWSESPPESIVEVRGYAALTGEDEVAWAQSRGVEATAVVALGRGTAIDDNDLVQIDGVDIYLDGTYHVVGVRSTPVHVRVLLSRRGPVADVADV